jgi:16S rRNA (cytidine1402-2'-O)-methyltransferase
LDQRDDRIDAAARRRRVGDVQSDEPAVVIDPHSRDAIHLGDARQHGRDHGSSAEAPHERSGQSRDGEHYVVGRVHERAQNTAVGKLYLVATPIGNLEDVSARALRVLQEVHMVACEDTRHTQVLLRRHGIQAKHLTSYTEFNHRRKVGELTGQLDRGWDVALVSDAGTPALSDPGESLVSAAIAAGHEVVPIPGPNAAIAALVASGLPTRAFAFVGFLPRKSGARRRLFEELIASGRTAVVYESPYRTADALSDLAAVAPNARVAVARELTKLHEEFIRGTAAELAARYEQKGPKGEVTIVFASPSGAG